MRSFHTTLMWMRATGNRPQRKIDSRRAQLGANADEQRHSSRSHIHPCSRQRRDRGLFNGTPRTSRARHSTFDTARAGADVRLHPSEPDDDRISVEPGMISETSGNLKSGEMGAIDGGWRDGRETAPGILRAVFGKDAASLRAARNQRPPDFQGHLPRLQQRLPRRHGQGRFLSSPRTALIHVDPWPLPCLGEARDDRFFLTQRRAIALLGWEPWGRQQHADAEERKGGPNQHRFDQTTKKQATPAARRLLPAPGHRRGRSEVRNEAAGAGRRV